MFLYVVAVVCMCMYYVGEVSAATCSYGKPGFFGDACTGSKSTVDTCVDDDAQTGYKVLECNKTPGSGKCESHFRDVFERFGAKCDASKTQVDPCDSTHMGCIQHKCQFIRREGDKCDSDEQCAEQSRCDVNTKRCVGIQELGECSTVAATYKKDQCTFGYYCGTYVDEEGYIKDGCVPKLQVGATCSRDDQCLYGVCSTSGTTKQCTADTPGNGATCDPAAAKPCKDGYFCNGADKKCKEWQAAGASCTAHAQCVDGTSCVGGKCTKNSALTCDDTLGANYCQGGCNCVNGPNAAGTCAGGETACQRSYKAMRQCEQDNCLFYGDIHFYPFDQEGCFQRHCSKFVNAYYTCQSDYHDFLNKPYPEMPFYNYEFNITDEGGTRPTPTPEPKPSSGIRTTTGQTNNHSTLVNALFGLGLMVLVATVL